MSLKILSTLAVVATVAEATNSLRSTQGPPNGGLNHNVQWTVSHNPTYGICDDDNTVLAQVEAGMKGCYAEFPLDRVCGEEECGRPNQLMNGIYTCTRPGMSCSRPKPTLAPTFTAPDVTGNHGAECSDFGPVGAFTCGPSCTAECVEEHTDHVHDPTHDLEPCGGLGSAGNVIMGKHESVQHKRFMCNTVDAEHTPKAHCRCVSRATETVKKAISICNFGCGLEVLNQGQVCNDSFGCTFDERACNSDKCTCKPASTQHDNMLSRGQCQFECGRVNMMVPATDEQVRSAVDTGCDSNNNEIWVQ